MPIHNHLETYKERIGQFMEEHIPFNKLVGFRLGEIRPGYAELYLDLRPELVGDIFRPALHGGVISAMADTCGGACLWTGLELGDVVSTVDLRVDYLRPCPTVGRLIAAGETRRLGNRVGVVNIKLYMTDAPDVILAEAMGVYNVVRGKRKKT